MIEIQSAFERAALDLAWAAAAVAAGVLLAVVAGRVAQAVRAAAHARIARRYEPLLRRALGGDADALSALATSPGRHRIEIARLLVLPLVENRDLGRVAAAAAIFEALQLLPIALTLLRSRSWWRRSVAVRALGLFRIQAHTDKLVAALDDAHPDVRNTALDALADMQNPAALPALVVRLHDSSLQRGRRLAALTVFGPAAEPFLLDLAQVDPEHRLNYARALAVCGTERSRETLGEWTTDARPEVRASAFEALTRVGLDERAAAKAVAALAGDEPPVRAAAAGALHGWMGAGDAAHRLAQHLDDTWAVAVRAARSLQAMGASGKRELEARAARSDLAGVLARQMLWEMEARA